MNKLNSKQMEINRILLNICNDFKQKTDVKNTYIEYLSALLYIKYKYNFFGSFDKIYHERKNYYIANIIDKEIQKIREEIKNNYLFSNVEFKRIKVYRELGEDNVIANILEKIYSLKDYDMEDIAKAYENILEYFIKKNDVMQEQKEYYTPSYITNMITNMIVGEESEKIFDPYCSSGNFFLSAAKMNMKEMTGVEKNISTYNICMTNLLLHNIDNKNVFYKENLQEKNMKYDRILTNPPFSQRDWVKDMKKEEIEYINQSGLPEKSVADYAYVLSMLNHLEKNGKMAVVLPHGVLFRENEVKVRKKLIEENLIDAIIGLPENLFNSTRMSVIVLIICKNRKDNDILFVDASKKYVNDRKNNILTEKIQNELVDIYSNRKEIEYFSHLASKKEIRENNYNLTIKRYVKEEITEKIKIEKQYIIRELQNLEAEQDILKENINDVLEMLDIKEIFIDQKKTDINKVDYKKIGNNIRAIRMKKDISLHKLAFNTNISPIYISRIESGMGNVKLERLVEICNGLGVSLIDILK